MPVELYRRSSANSFFVFRYNSCLDVTEIVLNPFPNKPWFLRVCSTSLLKTLWEKEKLLIISNFYFSRSVFYPFLRIFCHFLKIWNCRLQTLSVWKSLKFVVWERVKPCSAAREHSFILRRVQRKISLHIRAVYTLCYFILDIC